MQTQTGISDVCFTAACDGAGGADVSNDLAVFCAVPTCCNIQTSTENGETFTETPAGPKKAWLKKRMNFWGA